MTTLRVEARFKNARLYNAISDQAVPASSDNPQGAAMQRLRPIKAWCDFTGVSRSDVYALLNLRSRPLDGQQNVRPICARLAALLNCEVDWLFPADLYAIQWPRLAVEVPHEQIIVRLSAGPREVLALPPSQEESALQRELRREIGKALSTLTSREERVLRARFGLDDGETQTLANVAAALQVSRQRVRDIEGKALSRLRHPVHGRVLRGFLAGRTTS